MGQVYRATDTKLKRQVAIKILPPSLAADHDRLARFQREAEMLASLNHPNIAAIYGLEESDGITALVMELVEGEDLSQRIARGAIPLDEALPIAKQIAEALEAAHEQGIMHRDLKPANIKVRPNGTVKVLDFGLAKAMDPVGSAPNMSQSPTITTPAMTQAGMILGTAAYMSPEQAKGRAVDKRSDVWAFGCVLFEMLTGKRAFEGEDVSDTLAAVLRGEPDWDALPATTPAPIGKLLRGCLEKDRNERVPDIAVARLDIKEALAIPASNILAAAAARVVAPLPLWKRVIPIAATALLVAALTSVAWWSFKPSAPPPIVTRFSFPLPQGQSFSIANSHIVGMSPDGTRMVYAATTRLYLRAAWDLEPKAIPGTDSQGILRTPVFSPDGQSLVYYSSADQVLKRISVTGGAAVTLCPADLPFGISWGVNGIVFGQASKGIMRVSPNGGQPERLVSVKDGEVAHAPHVLPGGQAMLFTLATGTGVDRWDKAQVVVQSLKSGERKTLVNGGTDARYVPTGHIVYAVGGTLFALPFDAKRLEVAGGPVPIVEGVQRAVGIASAGSVQFSFSDTGSLVYIPGPAGALGAERALVLADRKGSSEILKLPTGAYGHPRISPDGKRVAFDTDDGKEAIVWIYDLAGTSSMRRLTFGQKNRFPIWSGDGQRIAFQSDREGDLGIFWQRADGTGTAERLTKPEQGTSHVPESWSPDGKRFLFAATKDSSTSLWAFVLEDKKATPFGDVQSRNPINAVFSPDGRWVAYYSNETGSDAIYVQPFPVTGAKYQIPKNDFGQNDHHPVWSSDGKELFYIPAPGALAAISVTTRPDVSFGNPVLLPRKFTASGGSAQSDIRNYALTPDGKILGLVEASEQTQSGNPDAPGFRVVLNWFEELKARVPAK